MILFDTTGVWDREDVENFLTTRTIPLRLSYRTDTDHTWIVSLWYYYRDGKLFCATNSSAEVVSSLSAYPNCSFEISTNEPPYSGVRGQCVAELDTDRNKETLRTLLDRYLGGTSSELAQQLLADERDETRIQLTINKVYSWDFTDRMKNAVMQSH